MGFRGAAPRLDAPELNGQGEENLQRGLSAHSWTPRVRAECSCDIEEVGWVAHRRILSVLGANLISFANGGCYEDILELV
jgi:hypothetical protein